MFNNSVLFGVFKIDDADVIRKISVSKKTQEAINAHFSDLTNSEKILDKERVKFDGRYKPEEDEVLCIRDYPILCDMIEAVKSPLRENSVEHSKRMIPHLKYIFLGKVEGDKHTVAFQVVRKSQHLTSEGIKLLQKKDTFEVIGQEGFTIGNKIDVLLTDGDLLFTSYHFARMVHDLTAYYKEATDDDLKNFINCKSIVSEDENTFYRNTDSWVRKKIALINDSGVLEQNSVHEIREIAVEYDVTIKTSHNGEKILLPNEKKELKSVLKFLDEDIYKGPLTDKMYESNSKRQKND